MGAGTELGLRIGRSVALWLPIGLVSAAGGYALRLVGPRTRRQRRVLENIGRAFPSTSDAERRAIAAEMWDNFGRTAAESLIIDRVAADPGRELGHQADRRDIEVETIGGEVVYTRQARSALTTITDDEMRKMR